MFEWFANIIVLLLVSRSLSVYQLKCMVHNSKLDHPERPRMPPKTYFPPSSMSAHVTSRKAMNATEVCEERYAVPVIWHKIMNSTKFGYVSDKTIRETMDVLNEGFRNSTLYFRLHSIRPVTNDIWTENCYKEKSSYMAHLAISPANNLNVYTCPFDLQRDQIVGNAESPWTHDQSSVYHGVVIHPEVLHGGAISEFNEGKNLIHEVGHHFGLEHYFEGGCDGDGDMVDDTPASTSTIGCPENPPNTCPDKPGLDPIHNYMGYGHDKCVFEFTRGQIVRMSWIVKEYKDKLTPIVYRPCMIDTVFRWSNGFVYFFFGQNYYRYNETSQSLDFDYPRSIKEHWRGVPDKIDGAFRYCNDITYFFKGSDYYQFNDTTLQVDPGYPKKIAEFWKGVPDNIDGVIRYSNGHTYFFKDNVYYRFNSTTGSVDPGYPKQMKDYWTGIPENIHGAFTWYNGGVYFFKDSEFWFFTSSVGESGIQAIYPKPIRIWWKDPQQFNGYTVFRNCNGHTYFFSGKQYWRYNDLRCSIDFTFPQLSSNWPGLPSKIDGMFVWSNGYLYVFSGENYYRFNQTTQTLIQGYPKKISFHWNGVPNDINAVFRSRDGLTYFFKDSYYYRFNDTTNEVETGYPKPISSFWKGVPGNLDTVFRWSNGQAYFFKGNYYYRFNFTKGAVDDGYPRHILGGWRGVLYDP